MSHFRCHFYLRMPLFGRTISDQGWVTELTTFKVSFQVIASTLRFNVTCDWPNTAAASGGAVEAFYKTECFHSHDGHRIKQKKRCQIKNSIGIGITKGTAFATVIFFKRYQPYLRLNLSFNTRRNVFPKLSTRISGIFHV